MGTWDLLRMGQSLAHTLRGGWTKWEREGGGGYSLNKVEHPFRHHNRHFFPFVIDHNHFRVTPGLPVKSTMV